MELADHPSICYENARPGHARFTEQTVDLSGPWKMLSLRSGESAPEHVTEPDFPDKKWEKIHLPAELPLREYRAAGMSVGLLAKSRQTDGETAITGETAYFRRSFRLSSEWQGRPVILYFGGVGASMRLWVNGQYAGRCCCSLLPVEFDITRFLTFEKNCICVELHQTGKIDAFLLPNQWIRRGIFGEICLYSLPVQRIEDLTAEAEFTPDGTPDGLHVSLVTRNAEGLLARIAVMKDNKVHFYADAAITGDCVTVRVPCPGAMLWSPEEPVLYRIAVILTDGAGIYHTRELPFGFRRITLGTAGLRLNGIPLKLCGVNYRRCGAEKALLRRDLETMRSAHLNALWVRSAMPEEFYDLCDETGMLVIDSSCLADADASLSGASREIEDRLICSRRHHPSILVWDVHLPRTEVNPLDATRPVTEDFYPIRDADPARLRQYLNHEDITDRPGGLLRLLSSGSTIAKETYEGLPFLVTSFGETVGNGAVDVWSYVELLRENDQLCGIFLWNFADQSCGGEWFDSCLTGLVREDGTPHHILPSVRDACQCLRFVRRNSNLTVQNFSRTRNLRDFEIVCRILRDTEVLETIPVSLEARPGDAATCSLRPKARMYQSGHYLLQITASLDDAVCAEASEVLTTVPQIREDNPGGSIRDEDGNVTLRVENITYVISRATGNLEQISLGGEELLLSPLAPEFTRPKTFFDRSQKQNEEWDRLTLKKKLPKPSVFEVDHMTRAVTVSQNIGSGLMRTYQLFSDGTLEMELRLRTGKTAPSRIGLSCALSEAFSRLRWLGLGPEDGYADRQTGLSFGLYEASTQGHDLYPMVQEYGSKLQVHALELSREDGAGITFQCRDGLMAGVRRWDLDTLCAAVDAASLPESDRVVLNLDAVQNGLSAAVIQPHTTYSFRFLLRPMG